MLKNVQINYTFCPCHLTCWIFLFAGKVKQVMQNETATRQVISSLSSKRTARALEKKSNLRSDQPVFKIFITEKFLRKGVPVSVLPP